MRVKPFKLSAETVGEFLPKDRLEHSIRVAESAAQLARHYGCDPDFCYQAGLARDIAKALNANKFAALGFPSTRLLDSLHNHYFPIWHAFAAPLILKHRFGIRNRLFLNTVQWHTTGKADMTIEEEILFVADYIEPGRPFGNRLEFEKIAFQNLRLAVAGISINVLQHLIKGRHRIHPYSLDTYNFYISQFSKDQLACLDSSITS